MFKVKEKFTHFNVALLITVYLNVLTQQVLSAGMMLLQLLGKDFLEHFFTYLTIVH